MDTDYGRVQFIFELPDTAIVYVYSIVGLTVKAAILDDRPYVSLLKIDKSNRAYFVKRKQRVYIDELEELIVI